MSLWNHFFTYIPSYFIRKLILTVVYRARLGNCNIHMGVKFFSPWKLEVGNGSNIQYGCFIDCRGGVKIGENTDITLQVKILSQDHDVRSESYATRDRSVNIGANCVVGSFALLLPGSVMENNSVLGSGAVLGSHLEECSIAIGNPAKVIGRRSSKINYLCSYKRPFH